MRTATRSIFAKVSSKCLSPAVGIQQAVEVVAFILIVGGSFQVITATGAITSGVARVVKKFKSKDVLIIPILMILSLWVEAPLAWLRKRSRSSQSSCQS